MLYELADIHIQSILDFVSVQLSAKQMKMVSVYLLPMVVAVITNGGFVADAEHIGCSNPDERCLPIRHCPSVYKRVLNKEYKRNITFWKEFKSMVCQPVKQIEMKTHICCPRSRIECRLNEKPGACLQREHCPTLNSTTEEKLMRSVEQNLCYVHEQKNYFCCTDPLCTSIKKLCDYQPKTKLTISAFPNCTSNRGTVGSLVPKQMCSCQSYPVLQLGNGRVCCVPPDPGRLISHRNAVKLAQLSCGTPGLELKIQNGTFAHRGEFPWMAILVYSTDLICSGTLIHPKYVLTTRHCIKSELVKVQLGKYDMEEDYTEWREEVLEITISRKLKHVRYDVGLLLLTKPATLQEGHVQPICLPLYSSLQMYLPQTVTISGWGVAFENQPMSVLRKANTPVLMSGKGCNEDHMICVGGVNHSNPCLGDSGGPYQALSKYGNNSGGRYVQYGIISEGPAICNRPVHPSRGVMVGYVIDWILDKMVL